MVKLSQLFVSFFKIGTFTIGGGYAMIPLMEKELVERHSWISKEDFMNILSLSQAMPGVFAVNMATHVGQKLRGFRGAVTAVIANILMPILIILGLAMFFHYFTGNHIVDSIFKGVRPAVVALIAAPVFKMAQTAKLNWKNFWIPLLAALLIWLFGVSPILIILVAGVGGFIYGKLKKR